MAKRGRKAISPDDRKSETLRVLVTQRVSQEIKTLEFINNISQADLLRLALLELTYPFNRDIINDPTFDSVRGLFYKRNKKERDDGDMPQVQS